MAARRDFGNLTRIRELTRETWGWGPAERLLQDLRGALWIMRRNPGFSAVAIGTLALGIASASAIFSVVSATLLTPPPYSEPERLMVLWETDRRTGRAREGLSGPDYIDLIERQQVFEDTAAAAFQTTPRTLTSRDQPPERVQASAVTPAFFEVYRRGPSFGRAFSESDALPGAARVAILNGGLWQSRFASEVGIVGQIGHSRWRGVHDRRGVRRTDADSLGDHRSVDTAVGARSWRPGAACAGRRCAFAFRRYRDPGVGRSEQDRATARGGVSSRERWPRTQANANVRQSMAISAPAGEYFPPHAMSRASQRSRTGRRRRRSAAAC